MVSYSSSDSVTTIVVDEGGVPGAVSYLELDVGHLGVLNDAL